MAGEILSHGVYTGLDGVPNKLRDNPTETFQLWFDPPTRKNLSLIEESTESAKQLRSKALDKEIVVLFDGSPSSEFVMNTFRLAKIPVVALCISYSDGYQAAATSSAERYLRHHKHIDSIWFKIDVTSWYRTNEIFALAKTNQAIDLTSTFHMSAIIANTKSSRVFVTSSATPRLVASDKDGVRSWHILMSEKATSIARFFKQRGVAGIPCWFLQNPSIFASFCYQPGWQSLVSNLRAPSDWDSSKLESEFLSYYAIPQFCRDGQLHSNRIVPVMDEVNKDWERQIENLYNTLWNQNYKEPILNLWKRLGITK